MLRFRLGSGYVAVRAASAPITEKRDPWANDPDRTTRREGGQR